MAEITMEAGHGQKMSRKQEALISGLLIKGTIAAAAAEAGIGERTARRWLQEKSFLIAYRAARQQLVEHSVARLQKAMQFSCTALLEILKNGSESNRLTAAKVILDYGLKGMDTDILSRLEELEKRLFPASTPSRNGIHP
jgi:hypothetical protein